MLVTGVVGGFTLRGVDRERADALADAKAGRFAQAEPALLEAHARSPADGEVNEALARGYAATDDIRAEPFLSRWIEARPDDGEALKLRFDFHRKRKDKRAYADARRLSEQNPDDFALRRTAMNQAFSHGYFSEAEELCRACLAEKPNDPGLRLMHAEIRRALGDNPGAAVILDGLLAAEPGHFAALHTRAILHEEAGEFDKAVPLLREAYRLDPQKRRAIGYLLSVALERTGQAEEARRVLTEVRFLQDSEVLGEALKGQPNNFDLQVRLARVYLDGGRTKEGLDRLRKLLAQVPGHAQAHLALADYYEQQGQAGEAANHRRLAGRAPATPQAP